MQETKETQETIERSPHDDSGYASSDLYDLLPDAQDQNPQKVSLTTQSLFISEESNIIIYLEPLVINIFKL